MFMAFPLCSWKQLPVEFTDWFSCSLENGMLLSFWDPRDCIRYEETPSPGLLYMDWVDGTDELCILDLSGLFEIAALER